MATPVSSASLLLGKWLANSMLGGVFVVSGFCGVWVGSLFGAEPSMAFGSASTWQGTTVLAIGVGTYVILLGSMAGLIVSATSPNSVEAQKRLQVSGLGAVLAFVVSSMGFVWLLRSSDRFAAAISPAIRQLVSMLDRGASPLQIALGVSIGVVFLVALAAVGNRVTSREWLWD